MWEVLMNDGSKTDGKNHRVAYEVRVVYAAKDLKNGKYRAWKRKKVQNKTTVVVEMVWVVVDKADGFSGMMWVGLRETKKAKEK